MMLGGIVLASLKTTTKYDFACADNGGRHWYMFIGFFGSLCIMQVTLFVVWGYK
jgi:hypothetical protein